MYDARENFMFSLKIYDSINYKQYIAYFMIHLQFMQKRERILHLARETAFFWNGKSEFSISVIFLKIEKRNLYYES